jgi:hypothetical protein
MGTATSETGTLTDWVERGGTASVCFWAFLGGGIRFTGQREQHDAPAEDDDFDSFDSAFSPLSTNALTDRMTRLQAPTCLSKYQHHMRPARPFPLSTHCRS